MCVCLQVLRESEEKRLRKLIAKPTYVRHEIFSNNLVGIEQRRREVQLCKPLYVGMAVLDLSKHLMYNFYYNHLKVS